MSTESGTKRAGKVAARSRRGAKRVSKRRDADPVRVYGDGRIAVWSGGSAGVGVRSFERCGSVEDAERRAAQLRERFAGQRVAAPRAMLTLDEAFQSMLAAMREESRASGTIKQYKSNWNVWVPDEVGAKRCIDVGMDTWSAIFDYVAKHGASQTTIASVARTMNAFTTWGYSHRYFTSAEPFGQTRWRTKYVQGKKLRAPAPTSKGRVRLEECPTVPDIEKFAAAAEEVYPGYGHRLVMFTFASGLRINEVLALRVEHINLTTGVIAVDWQLDVANHWPARKLPKGGKRRKALLWGNTLDVAATLVDDALTREHDNGWLFPRHRSTTGWARQASALVGEAAKACGWQWTFHWLRHAYASYSLAPSSEGGYGLNLPSVQQWLGHEKPSTTQDMYIARHKGDEARALETTRTMPGIAHPKAR